MSSPPFSFARHDAGRSRSGETVTLKPLDPALAPGLAARFAAMDPWAAYGYRAAALARYFAGGTSEAPVLAIMADGQLVGAIGLRLEWLLGPYIQILGLLPDAQASGIGSLVMDWAEREARRSGARNLWVAASATNAGALRFYERHGFTRAAELDGLVRDDRTEVLLRKRLA